MDFIAIIVAALAAGAAAGLKPAAEQAIKDAYAGLKALILRKYQGVSVDALEHKPGSAAKRDSVAEDLAEAGAGTDEELLDQAKALLDIIKTHTPETAAAMGIDFTRVEAGYISLKNIKTAGTAVKAEDVTVREGFVAEAIEAGVGRSAESKKS